MSVEIGFVSTIFKRDRSLLTLQLYSLLLFCLNLLKLKFDVILRFKMILLYNSNPWLEITSCSQNTLDLDTGEVF